MSLESKQRFFEEMDQAGVDWSFHEHARTPHGFALPARIGAPGHLYEPADRRSTQNMLSLFREVFPTSVNVLLSLMLRAHRSPSKSSALARYQDEKSGRVVPVI